MNASESNPQDQPPSNWLVHLLIEGDEEINYNHPMYQRWRAKNPPRSDSAEKPPTADGTPENGGPPPQVP